MHRKFKRLTKALIRLHVCAGLSESLLVAHIIFLEILCRGSFVPIFFQRGNYAHGSWNLAQVVITSSRNVIRIWGSHSLLLERAIVNVQAPGDRKKSVSLMVKIYVKYQQNWHLYDSLLLFVFFQCQ